MSNLIKLLPDALIVSGTGALSYGAGLLHPAAGFIVGGAVCIVLGILAARKAGE